MPVEFAGAAYRYGHSQIRSRYRLNLMTDPMPLFPDLLGFRPVPLEHTVDWTLSFDTSGAMTPQRCKKIDGKVVRALIQLQWPSPANAKSEIIIRSRCVTFSGVKASDCLQAKLWPATLQSRHSPLNKLESHPRVGWERLRSGTTFFAKPRPVQVVSILVLLEAGSLRKC